LDSKKSLRRQQQQQPSLLRQRKQSLQLRLRLLSGAALKIIRRLQRRQMRGNRVCALKSMNLPRWLLRQPIRAQKKMRRLKLMLVVVAVLPQMLQGRTTAPAGDDGRSRVTPIRNVRRRRTSEVNKEYSF
jgi:hypothetical protein